MTQNWAPPAPTPRPTTPARFGKIGFWVLLSAFGLFVASIVWREVSTRMALEGTSGILMSDYPWIQAGETFLLSLAWLAAAVSTALGIIGLVRRERRMWWSIVSAAAIPIYGIGLSVVGIVTFFVVMIMLAAANG